MSWRQAISQARVSLLAALLCAVAVLPAAAELLHTTTYRDHPVRGTTPGAVIRYMNAHPIIDPDDGPAWANLTHDHTLGIRSEKSAGQCRVADLTFRWKFVLTLPKAVDAGAMTPAVRQSWQAFRSSMKQHEEMHRTIFLECGRSFTAAAAKLTAVTCAALETKVRRFIDKRYAACMAKQREFEKRDRPRVMSSPFVRAATGG